MKKVTKRQPYSVPILMRAFDILEFLRGSDIPLKPNEISNAIGVSRTMTYRILHTFVCRGYFAQDPGGAGFLPRRGNEKCAHEIEP
jgi:DNA-binding IclR family transcriptional regulator